MADKKKPNELEQPVTPVAEEELEQISGGVYKPSTIGPDPVVRRDSRGNPTHWKSQGRVYHYICPHCKKLLHRGTLSRLYCDPCDESWFGITLSSEKRYGYYS